MRKDKQLAAVLAIALGAATPTFARQHQNAPSHPDSHPSAQHQSAPHQPAQHAPAPHQPAPRNFSQPPAMRPQPQREVAMPPQRVNNVDAGGPHTAAQHEVPHPPDRSNQRGNSGQVGAENNSSSQHVVPRPPDRNSGPSNADNINHNPKHVVPKPPNATGGNSVGQEPVVGNARPAVPHPPTIGTPRDVHTGKEPHAGDWLRHYSTMPAQQRQHALESDPNFKRLPSNDRQRYERQLNQFNSKSPQEQQRVINRMDAWGHLSDAQKQQARQTYGQLKAMPADRQQQVNAAFRRLRAMPPSAREQVMNSPEFQSRYSDQERQVIKSMTDINASLPHD